MSFPVSICWDTMIVGPEIADPVAFSFLLLITLFLFGMYLAASPNSQEHQTA